MNVEIRKVANGYMVCPTMDQRRDEYRCTADKVHVFETYRALVEKLDGILSRDEPKKAEL